MTLDWFSAQVISGIVNTLVPAVLLAAGVWLLLCALPKLNAATRYVAWWAVLAASLCLPILRFRPPVGPEPVAPVVQHIEQLRPLEQESRPPDPQLLSTWTLPVRLPNGKSALLLAAVWAAGVLASLLRLLLSYGNLRGILRRARPLHPALLARWIRHFGVRRTVRLLASDEIGSPLAAGFWQPAILIPECLLSRLDDDLADHVVIHELAHLGRHDDWANLLGRLLEAALWFHPVARFILRRVEFERELACDDWVVAATPSRRAYASSLTRLAEWRIDAAGHTLAASMVGRGSQVGQRVRSLLDPRRNAAIGISRRVLLLAMAVIGGLLVCATQTPGLVAFTEDQQEIEAPDAPEAPLAPEPPAPPQAPAAPRAPQAPATPPSDPGFLAALAEAGYGGLDVDEIVELKTHGVNADFIRQMNAAGFGKLTTRQLVEIRIHGVSPTYLAELKSVGISGYTLEQAKELKIHGVRPSEVAAIHALGFGPYSARQVTELKIHGVHEDFFHSLKENGITDVSHRDIVEAKIHSVSAKNLRDAQQYGKFKDIRRVIKLKQAGVL